MEVRLGVELGGDGFSIIRHLNVESLRQIVQSQNQVFHSLLQTMQALPGTEVISRVWTLLRKLRDSLVDN